MIDTGSLQSRTVRVPIWPGNLPRDDRVREAAARVQGLRLSRAEDMRPKYPITGKGVKINPRQILDRSKSHTVGRMSLLATTGIAVSRSWSIYPEAGLA